MIPIKVLIVSDDDLFRQRLDALFETTKGITVVGKARDIRAAIGLLDRTQPDIVLLDAGARGAGRPQTAVAQILEPFPQVKIIVLHEGGQEHLVLDALQGGAMGHLVKEKTGPDEIDAAICAVNRGEVILSSHIAGSMLDEVVRKQHGSDASH